MTVREFVRENGEAPKWVYYQFEKFMSNDNSVDTGYMSWALFQFYIKTGNWKKTQESLHYMQLAYTQARQAYKIFSRYTGEKKTAEFHKGSIHIAIDDSSTLCFNQYITPATLLKMSRLLRDAETRCKKHPSNANLGA